MRRWLFALLAALPLSLSAATLDYLYINANEGGASGGHVALKFGDDVFHFQQIPPGLLRIKRDDFAQFRQQYGERENRTIFLHHIAIADAAFERLHTQFQRSAVIEDAHFERLTGIDRDLHLLEKLQQPTGSALELPGLGLFFADTWQPAATINAASPLAHELEAELGAGFLAAKAHAVRAHLQALQPDDAPTLALSAEQFQPADYPFAERYADHLSALAALQVLADGVPLREDTVLRPAAAEFALSDAERQTLDAYRQRLRQQLPALLRSTRPDWGLALLVNLARRAVLEQSVRSGRLVVLNLAAPADPAAPPASADPSRDAAHQRQQAHFRQAKTALAAAGPLDEWAYAELEQSANRYLESAAAVAANRAPRLDGLTALPVPPARAVLPPAQRDWQSSAAALRDARQRYAAHLQRLYRYDLLTRNCATELFRRLNASGAPLPTIDPHSVARAPYFAYRAVGADWPVSASETLLSLRQRRLRQAETQQPSLLLALRESNVFSAQTYRWHSGDSAFVLFSDELTLLRPLAGGVNLSAGLAQSLVGLLTWPWDDGHNLAQGGKGVLVSLPELLFFNIRKGSFPAVGVFVE